MMKKKLLILILIMMTALTSLFALTGCNTTMNEDSAWSEFEKAIAESSEYFNNKDYFVKYRYKDGSTTVTHSLNVAYGNSKIKDWDDFVIANKGVVKESNIKTTYGNTYFGYSLRAKVKAKKATREDYKLGYFDGNGTFFESNDANEFFALKSGDSYNGKEVSEDEETYKYTLQYALGTLEGINKENAQLLSATKSGVVITLKFAVKAEGLYYSAYNQASNCLTVRITVGRISKISSADENQPCYFINYAGPKFGLASYDAKSEE